ncbi:hypothetical protein F0L68_30745 [Solihabitans fulvus]|uniref:Phospholipase A2 n=1 Tax=Solihabitans fulvus TaxID=1892852 RepID=A0A5B2WTX6_9PSEU|nr:phospholipase A2 [Solihabitans fulvus]KAA2254304.1 hypothetical protein F0L68_30745 [Solihabitans fulvus]
MATDSGGDAQDTDVRAGDDDARHHHGWPGLRFLTWLPAWFRFSVVAVIVFVCAVVASRPGDDPAPVHPVGDVAAAAKALNSLTDPSPDHDPAADFPADFVSVQGTVPKTVRGPDGTLRAINPGGGCSGPAGDTAWDFSVICEAHDLGYDLLRYAEHQGQQLGPDARRRLDDRLTADMRARCDGNPRGSLAECHAVADVYTAGLVVNSWRQRWGPPRHEPAISWAVGIAAIVLLLMARMPGRRAGRRRIPAPRVATLLPAAPRPPPADAPHYDRYASFLRLVSLAVVVLGQSLLTVAYWAGVSANWLWLVTWVVQAAPVFFFAGGQANLLSWRAVQAEHGGFGRYLTERISWLLRPMLAFVLAWVVLPLPLDLLEAPSERVAALSRLIAHPLWFLGVYLGAVAATPVMAWLHRRLRFAVPLGLGGAVALVDACRVGFGWGAGGYVNVALAALVLQQLGFCYADGDLARLSRRTLAVVGALCVPALLLLTSGGGYPRNMMGTPAEPASNINPPTFCLLVLGVGQLCVAMLLRDRVSAWLAGHRQWRLVCFAKSTPITLYLAYLTVLTVVLALLGVLDGPVVTALGWLTGPRWLAVLAVLLVPALVLCHRFERRVQLFSPVEGIESHRGRLAATLGVFYGALGALGFVVTGFAGSRATLVVLPVDSLQNLVHLLLGWYLVHTARVGSCHRRLPWLLTAVACVPPLLDPAPDPLVVGLHAATICVALLAALPGRAPGGPVRPGWNRLLPPMLRLPAPTSAARSDRSATPPTQPAR